MISLLTMTAVLLILSTLKEGEFLEWDGKTLASTVEKELYGFFGHTFFGERNIIPNALQMGNTEYADFLKSKFVNSGAPGYTGQYKTYIHARDMGIEICFKDPIPVELYGENVIKLTWSMAARHIRAWEYEKAHGDAQTESTTQHKLSAAQEQWAKTHLCGSKYDDTLCEFFLEADSNETIVNGKKLDHCCYYCTSENKIRKIGSGGSWTGLSPKFCPKRKALEQNINEPSEEDIFLFEQYEETYRRSCRFEKVLGFDDKYAKQHRDKAHELYSEIVDKGLEPAYKKWYKMRRDRIEEDAMARKLQLDAGIAKDMKSAAFDSFIDNIKMIDVKEILPSEKNFYKMSAIELLADDIEREGLKHNLVVVKDPSTGCYEVKSGHRRLAAIELLIKEKRIKNTKIPCIVDGEKTEAENEFDLIMLNATQRKYTDAETMSEYERLSETLKALKNEGKGLSGRIRDNIATLLGVSNGQVGKLDNIKNNAAEEVKEAVKSGEMSISTANEVAKLAPEKQKEIVKQKPDISSADVKKMQDKKSSAPLKPTASPSIDTDELDDDFEELDEGNSDVIPEKKSSLTLSLILSDNEAKTLLRFFYGFGDDFGAVSASDADDLREIEAKLRTLCGDL